MNELDRLVESILEKVDQAMGEVAADYNEEVDAVIQSADAFADLGFEDQDIVDTGRLLSSKLVDAERTNQSSSVSFAWDPSDTKTGFKYANAVWSGFFAFGGEKFIRGRHWPERAAKNMKVTQAFVDYLKQTGLDASIITDGDDNLDD